ncbi:MAG: dihydrolipoyllysine-residue acetyltransferase [Polycyclovorans sp.]
MANTIEVKVPNIGDFESVPVIEMLVAEGDTVEKDQALMVLESDKATMDVPSPAAGKVTGLKVKVGDKVGEGSLVCSLSGQTDAAADDAAADADADADADSEAPEGRHDAPPSEPEGHEDEKTAETAESAGGPARGSARQTQAGPYTVTVPNIGDFESVPVIELLVAEGDTVEKDQALVVLESDKATMDVPSPVAGTVTSLKLKVGDKVGEGAEVCVLTPADGAGDDDDDDDGAADDAPAQQTASAETQPAREPPAAAKAPIADTPEAQPNAGPQAKTTAPATQADGEPFYAGPATRKVARQFGVDLSKVSGSGARGRIVIEDVQAYVKAELAKPAAGSGGARAAGGGIPPIPAQDYAQFGPVETKALARIRKLSAAHLSRSWLNVPHVTQHDDADITELEAFRKSAGDYTEAKLTLLPFLIKAVGLVIKRYPEFNSALAADGESIVLKGYCNIGFAADTPNGLVVPVVKDVWAKSVGELAADCARLANTARDGKLKPDDLRGGCFSISSLGGIGGKYFTPIVNAPEVAILGVSRSSLQPVWDGANFAPRLLLPLSLSYDHRVIDGAAAARFVVLLGALLADVRRWVL